MHNKQCDRRQVAGGGFMTAAVKFFLTQGFGSMFVHPLECFENIATEPLEPPHERQSQTPGDDPTLQYIYLVQNRACNFGAAPS